jgi:hypothetical protein
MLGETDLWRRLREEIEKEAQRVADEILGNMDIERYRRECGFLRGLRWVVSQAQTIAEGARPPAEREGASEEEGEEDAG